MTLFICSACVGSTHPQIAKKIITLRQHLDLHISCIRQRPSVLNMNIPPKNGNPSPKAPLLTSPQVSLSMDRYRFGALKRNVPYETGFLDAFHYLFIGEVLLKPLTDMEAIIFSKFLSFNASLVHLDVSSNLIKDWGALAIAEFLSCNSTLKTLNIANNGFEDVGDRALDTFLDAIVLHPQLRSVRFSFNTLPIPLKDFDEAEVGFENLTKIEFCLHQHSVVV